VLIATALAVLASTGEFLELHSAQQSADRNATVTSVYVLSGDVPQGESVATAHSQGLIKAAKTPLQFVPTGAVRSLADIGDQVSWYRLPAGEVVVSGMFVPPKTMGSLAAELPRHDVAVSVTTSPVQSVAGLIQPGDKVDILVNINGDEERDLYQSVSVLAVGTTLARAQHSATTAITGAKPSDVITFAVPLLIAAGIAEANSDRGGLTRGLYLALEPAGSRGAPTESVNGPNLVIGGPMISVHVEKSGTDEKTP
jgi:Flp pilus assembly protein CpaB